MTTHAYPHDLARLVQRRWVEAVRETPSDHGEALPRTPLLERLISVCYQASLLREEDRPTTFRVAVADPETFSETDGPPTGLHRLALASPRPFDENELRRLAPAAAFEQSLIGLRPAGDDLEIWGIIHSGPRWLEAIRGGRHIEQSIPRVLMAAVSGPGRVLVSRGTHALAALAGGTLADLATDVFRAPWLAARFGGLHADVARSLDPAFGRHLAEHVLRRIVATIRSARRGGTLVFLPSEGASEHVGPNGCLSLKYALRDDEARRRISSLTGRITSELAGQLGTEKPGWADYESSHGSRLAALDEELFEVAHLVASLADVDGAVVMTDQFEVLGFGAEIAGSLPDVSSVDRSLDIAGVRRLGERTDRVGTRHRSSYRLCQHVHGALAIVLSQDGGVRFVRWHDERVTYFDQIATGPWEV